MLKTLRSILAIAAAAGATLLLSGCKDEGDSASQSATPPVAQLAKSEVRHVDPGAAETLLASDKSVVVVDVRTPKEFADGHIAGATNIDFNGADFSTELGKLDRNTTYLVHCAAGGRSTRSLATFQNLGFKSVVHLDGGMNAWRDAGKPIEK